MIPELKPITEKVRKFRGELLAQIDVPIHYAGEHWLCIDVYGMFDKDEAGNRTVDIKCYHDDERIDNILPESLLQTFANEILRGDHE